MAAVSLIASRDEPQASLSQLHRADGSAAYTSPSGSYSVMAAVNGPIEVQRRDELPEEAAVDVVVRPAAGIGGTRERHLESILQSTLRQIILTQNFPRKLIQVILQVISTPDETSKINQASANLPLLPSLLQASILALLSAAIPLSSTLTSTILALTTDSGKNSIIENPSHLQIQAASSIHVLAFTSQRQLLLTESEGSFSLNDWDEVYQYALNSCCGSGENDPDAMQDVGEEKSDEGMMRLIKSTMRTKVLEDLHWQKS